MQTKTLPSMGGATTFFPKLKKRFKMKKRGDKKKWWRGGQGGGRLEHTPQYEKETKRI